MRGKLKNVIKVSTLANGQFEVTMVLSEKKSRAKVTVLPHASAGEQVIPEQTNQNILLFRQYSITAEPLAK